MNEMLKLQKKMTITVVHKSHLLYFRSYERQMTDWNVISDNLPLQYAANWFMNQSFRQVLWTGSTNAQIRSDSKERLIQELVIAISLMNSEYECAKKC